MRYFCSQKLKQNVTRMLDFIPTPAGCSDKEHEQLCGQLEQMVKGGDDEKIYLYRYVPLFSLLHSYDGCERLFMRRVDDWNDPYEERLFRIEFSDEADGCDFTHPLQNQVYGTSFTTGYNCEGQWRNYEDATNGPVVLLQINASRLFDALRQSKRQFYVGCVAYFDQNKVTDQIKKIVKDNAEVYKHYKGESANRESLLQPIFIKRQAFSYEREVRILTIEPGHDDKVLLADVNGFTHLISQIIVSPLCSGPWQKAQKSILEKEYAAPAIHASALLRRSKTNLKVVFNSMQSVDNSSINLN